MDVDVFTTYAQGVFRQASVHSMCQDERGCLWFCTQDGLLRFDGATWATYGLDNGLTHPHTWAIVEDPNAPNTFWLGTAGAGLCRFRPDEGGADRSAAFAVAGGDAFALAFDPKGRLWVVTNEGVSLCDVKSFSARTIMSTPSHCILQDGDLTWIGTREGDAIAYDAAGTEVKRYTGLGKGEVAALTKDAGGSLWIGFSESGVVRVEADGQKTLLRTQEGMPHERVSAALCDREGNVWLCTWGGGVARTKQRQFGRRIVLSHLTQKDGLASNTLQSIFEDRQGRYWFGTVGAGVTCMTPSQVRRPKVFQTFSTKDGLGHDMVAAIGQDKKDRLWFGCFSGGVTRYDPTEKLRPWRVYGTKDGLGHDTVRCVTADSKGTVWVATPGGGLAYFDEVSQAWKQVRVKDGLPSDVTRWITRSDDGRFYVATDAGAVSFDPLTVTSWKKIEGLPSQQIMHIHEDGKKLWICYAASGFTVWDRASGEMKHYDESNGLPSNHLIMMTTDAQGRAWFGSNGAGLICFDGERFRTFGVAEGLPHDVVYSVVVHKNEVWGSTVRGVFRLIDERVMTFDQSDGLGGDECNGRAVLLDRTHRLWFGNTGGASWIAPNDVATAASPARVFVTGLKTRTHKGDERIESLSASARTITAYEFIFDYIAVEHISPHKIEFRFRLKGLEEYWVRRTADRSIRYTNLAPGNYVFEVSARNWTGQWSEPAALTFSVA